MLFLVALRDLERRGHLRMAHLSREVDEEPPFVRVCQLGHVDRMKRLDDGRSRVVEHLKHAETDDTVNVGHGRLDRRVAAELLDREHGKVAVLLLLITKTAY